MTGHCWCYCWYCCVIVKRSRIRRKIRLGVSKLCDQKDISEFCGDLKRPKQMNQIQSWLSGLGLGLGFVFLISSTCNSDLCLTSASKLSSTLLSKDQNCVDIQLPIWKSKKTCGKGTTVSNIPQCWQGTEHQSSLICVWLSSGPPCIPIKRPTRCAGPFCGMRKEFGICSSVRLFGPLKNLHKIFQFCLSYFHVTEAWF